MSHFSPQQQFPSQSRQSPAKDGPGWAAFTLGVVAAAATVVLIFIPRGSVAGAVIPELVVFAMATAALGCGVVGISHARAGRASNMWLAVTGLVLGALVMAYVVIGLIALAVLLSG